MSNAPEPEGPNPFNVGDLVEVVIPGFSAHKKGDRFVVSAVDEHHVSWLDSGVGGGWFTRYKLVRSAERASKTTDEYEAALEAQEAYQTLQVPK